jgi:hypothetical protein
VALLLSALGHWETGSDWEQGYVMLNPSGLVTLPPLAPPSSSTLSFWASFILRATSAMPLLDLPKELLQNISEYLESDRDINAIAQANCRLYCLLDSYLYRYNNLEAQRCCGLPDITKR